MIHDELKRTQRAFGKLLPGLFDWRGVQLVQEDWDFCKCDKEQFGYCLDYECRRDVVLWRERPDCFELGKYFPKTPWLKIPPLQRRGIIDPRSYVGILGEVSPEFLKGKDGKLCWRKVEASKIVPGQLVSFHAFMVNWSWSKTKLTRCFGDWLDFIQTEIEAGDARFRCEPRKRMGQEGKTTRELLKVIGARRLVLAYGAEMATEKFFKDSPESRDSSVMWRYKGQADRYLQRTYC